MQDVQVRRLDGERGALGREALDDLRERVGDRLVTAEDAEYEAARRVWNGMIDRHPTLVVRCSGAADVIAAVAFASENGLRLAVRGGGHNVAGFGTCEGGLVVDLSAMNGVRVNPKARTVRAGGGADVDRETQVHGLAVPGGIVSTTGVGGLTLGGGQGWLRRTCGMTCDSLISADVVLASGEVVCASETENADLFWALRGGGGNFGVVTSFEFRAWPVGPMVAFAGPTYPLESASRVMTGVAAYAASAPDEVNVSTTWWTIPPVPGFPEEFHGRQVIVVGAVYAGPTETGEEVLDPLRRVADPLLDLSTVLPYSALQQMFDPFFPPGSLHYYWKSLYLADLGEDAVRILAEHVASRPSSLSMVAVWALGGVFARVDPSATASGARDAPFLMEILANWQDPADSDENIRWAQRLFEAMEVHGTGKTNVNFPGLGDEPGYGRAAFGDHWSRLVAVKRKYDPENLFRLNQNIDPRA
jgi:FAD/FMN-containing dehydrogenase